MSDTPAVFAAMSAVKRDVAFIGKNQRNKHFNFNFRGVDDVMNAFHAPMVEHGLVMVPIVEDTEYVQAADAVRCRLTLRLRFYAQDGSHIDAVGKGEAIDKQDKATPQAMQQAFKYTLLQAFSVPTQDMEDNDASAPVQTGQDGTSPSSPSARPAPQHSDGPPPCARCDGEMEWPEATKEDGEFVHRGGCAA